MEFNPDNEVVRLCIKGITEEGEGRPATAKTCYEQAWRLAVNDFEKFTAAHYLARQQDSVAEKLHWDEIALQHALNHSDEGIKQYLPSLYLNIAKCYEDLGEISTAQLRYQDASEFTAYLNHDGYGNMIRAGIEQGLKRTLLFTKDTSERS
ncbi:rRNA adenine methyltransferase [Paraflavitalea pollutisoli]|uniref:rRNA adenine methyltransferase n=1 Tax=Paraflavitalea pollutisoli TaxID=3034143 RepID=UPI0023EC945A|nr:rRNA adenine methyltransferase [Paraflavitalea sp. H1-2-19X]